MRDDHISLESRVRRVETVFNAQVGGDIVLFDPEEGAYYGAGPVGEAIWQLLVDEMTVEAVCLALLERFDVDRETCETETVAFIEQLAESGLIEHL